LNAPSDSIDVRQIAQLARLGLRPEEIETFQAQLEKVLEHAKKILSVDVTSVEPTTYAQPIFNVLRTDEALPGLEREAALANAPKSAHGLFMVTKVVE